MKKTETRSTCVCDNCAREAYHHCAGCQRDYCFECKEFYREFQNGVYHSGMDLTVCSECLTKPPEKIKKILEAYQLIQALRAENDAFYKAFKPRQEKAEKAIEAFYSILRNLR